MNSQGPTFNPFAIRQNFCRNIKVTSAGLKKRRKAISIVELYFMIAEKENQNMQLIVLNNNESYQATINFRRQLISF